MKKAFETEAEFSRRLDEDKLFEMKACAISKIVTNANIGNKTTAQRENELKVLHRDVVNKKIRWTCIIDDVVKNDNPKYPGTYKASTVVPHCFFYDKKSGINKRTGTYHQSYWVILYGGDELLSISKNQKITIEGIIREIDFYPQIFRYIQTIPCRRLQGRFHRLKQNLTVNPSLFLHITKRR